MDEATRPGVFALGVEMTRMPERQRSAPIAPAFDFSTLVPPRPAAAAPAPFDFAALSGPAGPPPPAASPSRSEAFSFGGQTAPAVAPPAFDFSTLTSAPPPAAAPAASPHRGAPPAAIATPAFDFSSLGAMGAPPPFDGGVEFDPLGAGPPPPPVRSPSRPMPPAALPAPPPSAPGLPPPGGTDDFFGAPMPSASPEAAKQLLDIPEEANQDDVKSALFDMPAPPPAASLAVTELSPALNVAPPMASSGASPGAFPAQSEQPGRRRTAVGVVVNLLIAAVLVAALVVVGSALLNDGKLTRDSLSLDTLRSTFVPATDLVPTDISNGLYATRAGRAVFFVRGEVLNGSATATRISVQADIVEGAHVVRSAKGLAGAVPTPEELYDLVAADDLEKLTGRIGARAVVVDPGASVPFLVTFTEYPPDLKAFRVRVVAHADGAGPTAQRP